MLMILVLETSKICQDKCELSREQTLISEDLLYISWELVSSKQPLYGAHAPMPFNKRLWVKRVTTINYVQHFMVLIGKRKEQKVRSQ